MTLRQKDLDQLAAHGCTGCGKCCTELHEEIMFTSKCCQADPLVSYVASEGIIRLICPECEQLVAEIEVAE